MINNTKIKGGEILYASHTLDGTYFENALILLVDNNQDGVFGVILNRPSRMPLNEIFNVTFNIPINDHLIYSGGPMDDDMLLTLRIHDGSGSIGGIALSDTVEYGGQWESMETILMSDDRKVRMFLGYAGWKERQLDGEIAEGSWTIYRGIDTKQVLDDWYNPLFEKRRDIVNYLESNCSK